MNLLDSLAALPALLAVFGIGRTLLALLPPGALGAHRPRTFGATWAASQLLGSIVLALVIELAGAFRSSSPERSAIAWSVVPWIAIAFARWWLGPAGLVPRHDPEPPRWTPVPRALAVLAFPIALWAWASAAPPAEPAGDLARTLAGAFAFGRERGSGIAFEAATVAAALFLVDHALATARRAPMVRARTLVFVAACIYAARDELRGGAGVPAMLALSGGAAGSVAWLRRADRRGLGVATLSFGGAALFAPAASVFAVAGGAGLIALTARATRRDALVWVGAAVVPVVAWRAALGHASATTFGTLGTVLAVVCALVFARIVAAPRVVRDDRADVGAPAIDATRREATAIALALLLVFGGVAVADMVRSSARPSSSALGAIAPVLPMLAVLLGLVGRPDDPVRRVA